MIRYLIFLKKKKYGDYPLRNTYIFFDNESADPNSLGGAIQRGIMLH